MEVKINVEMQLLISFPTMEPGGCGKPWGIFVHHIDPSEKPWEMPKGSEQTGPILYFIIKNMVQNYYSKEPHMIFFGLVRPGR